MRALGGVEGEVGGTESGRSTRRGIDVLRGEWEDTSLVSDEDGKLDVVESEANMALTDELRRLLCFASIVSLLETLCVITCGATLKSPSLLELPWPLSIPSMRAVLSSLSSLPRSLIDCSELIPP